jgi:hypothetical protein
MRGEGKTKITLPKYIKVSKGRRSDMRKLTLIAA